MELFPAANEQKWTLIKQVIDDCDSEAVRGEDVQALGDGGASGLGREPESSARIQPMAGDCVMSLTRLGPADLETEPESV